MTIGKMEIPVALALIGWCVFVFWSCRFEADFPMNYHWDEMSKSAQVKEGKRNLLHPLFILNTTEAGVGLVSDKTVLTYTEITHFGRALSALWIALAVWCVAVLAHRQGGWMAALMVAALSGLSPAALEAGHLFKEHAAVLLGIAVALLGLDAYAEKQTTRRAFWMGLAVGFSLSTKYAAIIVLPFWVWMLLLPCGAGPVSASARAGVRISLLGALAAFVAVNFHPGWFGHGADFAKGLQGEISLLASGHHGSGVAVPHRIFWERWMSAGPAVYFWAAVCSPWLLWILVFREKGERAVSLARAGLLFMAVANTVAVSFVAKLSHEYLWPTLFFMSLPVGVLAARLAGMAGSSIRAKGNPWAVAAVLAGFAVLVAVQFSSWRTLLKGYQSDVRRDLVRFIQREVPADAVIAQDQFVGLACPGDLFLIEAEKQVPNKVLGGYFLADLGTVGELKQQGVGYVAVNMEQGRHYLEMKLINPTNQGEFQRRRRFYEELRRQGELVWESRTGEPILMKPWLRLYRLKMD